jgi:hypothetical protein
MANARYPVTVQKWVECECGMGIRPDGYSLHLNDADRVAYIREYWQKMPSDPVPDEYSRPYGTPYTAEVDTEIFVEIGISKNGIGKNGNLPGSGGIDGFINVRQ